MSAPVDRIECHQNTTSYDDNFNGTSSSSSSPWLPRQQLVFIESEPSTVVCVVEGGYPPPRVRLYAGPVDVTGLFDERARHVQVTGVRGLRRTVYRTEISTSRLVLKYSHSQLAFRCIATVPGLLAKSLYMTTSLHCQYRFFRPRYQTEIVNGAHPGAGARIAYTRAMSEHRCFPKKETKYSYNAFQMTSQKSI